MKNKLNTQQLAVEFISVVFAVILALVLNSWRESSALNANLQKVKESIFQEVKSNDALLRKSLDYRKELLQKLYSNQNLLLAVASADLDFDVNDNTKLANFFKRSLIFGQKEYRENIMVMQEDDSRVLIFGESVFDLKLEQDTLKLMGVGNIQLKLPNINNRSWDLAQATGTVVRMNVTLVEKLGVVNSLIETYLKTSESAVEMVYNGKQKGLISVLEDLKSLEEKIIEANASLLEELQ
ncbi:MULTISPECIES: hypothetical protein [Roseivirga]|mgnify:CR=1 FL=1|jgi:hypothetical protein|uniref:Double Cache domain-containing protein n=1 Tax=Roseivirga thermotolerans TaxID=1758176 RepID=A0ABQ3I7V8_9BACT|nr:MULTISPECIES: hypothetical protein [Roseivirga]MEC7753569.1 hypothetical protein [Bacteroidota bacterium]GHE70625.1 hypothetical protein GCM10011340_27910 [Roseivirga thermotolerans]|tara:strand:- start:1094 stop:1810 length:717 start_codon:yes stop_codon:yes gene_type:complete